MARVVTVRSRKTNPEIWDSGRGGFRHEPLDEEFVERMYWSGSTERISKPGVVMTRRRAEQRVRHILGATGNYSQTEIRTLVEAFVRGYEDQDTSRRNPLGAAFMESLVSGIGTGTGMAAAAGLLAPMVIGRVKKMAKGVGLVPVKGNLGQSGRGGRGRGR